MTVPEYPYVVVSVRQHSKQFLAVATVTIHLAVDEASIYQCSAPTPIEAISASIVLAEDVHGPIPPDLRTEIYAELNL